MLLKSIEIIGFKSFLQKQKFNFDSKIVGIVGPNGSGKSNITEAFRFVLGEQSIKNLRGRKGDDLIYQGKNQKLKKASVKIVFDNSEKFFNLDYNEISLERIVYIDGVNDYLINDSKVRVRDFVSLLGQSGFVSFSHFIISQGESNHILNISSKERKIVIEDSLGLKYYHNQIFDSKKNLKKVEENLKIISLEIKENEPQLKFLQRNVEKLKNIKNLTDQLKFKAEVFFPCKENILNKLLKENIYKIDELQENKNKLEIEIKSKKVKKNNETLIKYQKDLDLLLEQERKIKSEKDLKNLELGKASGKIDFLKSQKQKEKISAESEILSSDSFQDNLMKIIKDKIIFKIVLDFLKQALIFKPDNDINSNELIYLEKNLISQEKEIFNLNQNLLETEERVEVFKRNIQEERYRDKNLDLTNENQELLISKINFEISSFIEKKFFIEREISEITEEKNKIINLFGKHFFNFNLKDNLNSSNDELDVLKKEIFRLIIKLEDSQNYLLNNQNIQKEHNTLFDRQNFLNSEIKDLELSKSKLNVVIVSLEEKLKNEFSSGLIKINSKFDQYFKTIFNGGTAELFLTKIQSKKDELNIEIEEGLDIKLSLPNKKIKDLNFLSGGEKSLTSIALLFSISGVSPPPFIILDETDAPLDEANSIRYANMLNQLSKKSSLIMVTHNRETMSRADVLYGITMDNSGSSKVLSVLLTDAEKYAK